MPLLPYKFRFVQDDYYPTIPTCPLWAHEKQVIVSATYCHESKCKWLKFYHTTGVECGHGDDDFKQQLEAAGLLEV